MEDRSELLKKVASFPRVSGVYIMRDASGQVIYVGKAKSLRERVKSYFNGHDDRAQIAYLMMRVLDIESIVTGTEQQAFILERDLIGKYKPRYNIRLKDDKAFLSIRVDENSAWPRLELVRKIQDDGARYYGPYSFGHELRTLLDVIRRVIPLRTCNDTIFFNRQRPCLEYQIKRCAGPCCLPVDREEYLSWVKQARAILEGRTDSLIKEFTARMDRAAEELRFEDAAAHRDRVKTLQSVKQGQQFVSSSGEDRDVFAIYREERLVVVSVLKVRRGRIADNQNFTLEDVAVEEPEILEASVSQYYEGDKDIPDEIILPLEFENQSLVQERLNQKAGRKVPFVVPKLGVKARLLGLAKLNAQEHFSSIFDATSRYEEVSRSLARLFGLKQAPRRIECVDISNFQGSDIVGALVCFYDGRPHKDGYRKYKISQQDKPDDFNSIYEVVGRRLKNGMQDADLPDLLVIDGGPGQLAKAIQAREELNLSLDIVGLAKERTLSEVEESDIQKKPERIYLEGAAQALVLEPGKAHTNFLVRLRDETHRFVITFHRQTRGKRAVRSKLDDIAGVSPERRSRLLRAFGSVAGIRAASVEDVAKAGRMPLPLARKILQRLD